MGKFNILLFFILISFGLNAQNVGIGTASPDASAKLDIVSTSGGILIPRVNIQSATDATTIPSPATGLMVWNTGATFGTAGFYFNSGTTVSPTWVRVLDSSSSLNDADADPSNELQDLGNSVSGTDRTITITGGSSTTISVADNDNDSSNEIQTLSYTKPNLTLSLGGGSINLADLDNGDVTEIVAGDGMTGGGTNGSITVNAIGDNGLTTNANDIDLGGALNQNTTITQGSYGMIYNLDGAGDFVVQDAGVNHFEVRDNGITYFGDDTRWHDGSTSGTIIAQMIDDGDDGRLIIYENGATQISLDANGTSVFNEQGLDRDFRVESNDNANMIRVDALSNEVGIGTGSPDAMLDVEGNFKVTGVNSKVQFNTKEVNNGWTLIYRDDFQAGLDGWNMYENITSGTVSTERTRTNVSAVGVSTILHNYNTGSDNDNVLKKMYDMSGVTWTEARIHFTYYFIDSWDNEEGWVGVSTSLTGNPAILWQMEYEEGDGPQYTFIGSGSYSDKAYSGHISVNNDMGGNIYLYIGSTLGSNTNDESYGIDNIEVWVR
ncbi:MAG: hypothetical protein KDE33_04865 [Bacteroidetes bacterium]|nr:hypothetical protein [Bacteroidota bacterium]MCB9226527.1 hypothetical protein [Chitinophagales bacterium]